MEICKQWDYSTKLAYKRLIPELISDHEGAATQLAAFKELWDSLVPRRVTMIVWKVLRKRILRKDNLRKREVQLTNEEMKCALCNEQEEENIFHIYSLSATQRKTYGRRYSVRLRYLQQCIMTLL